MSTAQRELLKTIEYPESDGEPMAETQVHAELMIDLRFALRNFFRDDPQTYVGVNMLMYYVEGDARKSVAPDVFVVRDNSKEPKRRTWKVWEEGKAPDVVIELSSASTFEEDLQKKWHAYSQMGVREYYIFDPLYEFLKRPLLAYRLEGGELIRVIPNQGVVSSQALGLDLVDTGETLRLRDPQTGEFLLTEQEETERAEQEARRAEQEARRAEQEAKRAEQAMAAAAVAEATAAKLAAKLRELGVDPNQV